jgi:hypothetical protein
LKASCESLCVARGQFRCALLHSQIMTSENFRPRGTIVQLT